MYEELQDIPLEELENLLRTLKATPRASRDAQWAEHLAAVVKEYCTRHGIPNNLPAAPDTCSTEVM
jgi:hypothetical protein